MRTVSFHADDLANALRRLKTATMPELKLALGTAVDVTVFRKLKQIAYRTSYSHRGAYYTLDETARFGESGLWSFQSVWFSRWGTLLNTAEAYVDNSAAGCFVEELDNLLHTGTKEPLLKLVRQERVTRQLVGGLYLYCSIKVAPRERQLRARRALQADPQLAGSAIASPEVTAEMKAAMCCSAACWMKSNDVSTPGWNRSNSATAAINGLPRSSAWTLTPWPRADAN